MSPHQHGEVGIGVFEIEPMSWLFTRQNSALLSLLFQMQKFLNGIIAFSSPFTNANDRAWVGMRIAIRILDHAAKLRIPLLSGLLEALLCVSTQEVRGRQTERLEFAVYQGHIRNLSPDQSRLEQDAQMRAESLQRSLGQLRQDHRAAEMHPSVAMPRVSVILVTPALPTFAVVFERIIQAHTAAGFGSQCRRPWSRIQNDGFQAFTGILWLAEIGRSAEMCCVLLRSVRFTICTPPDSLPGTLFVIIKPSGDGGWLEGWTGDSAGGNGTEEKQDEALGSLQSTALTRLCNYLYTYGTGRRRGWRRMH